MGPKKKIGKCIVCGRRMGKRRCLGIQGAICSQCCGSERRKTIDCPSDCTYLNTGEEYFNLRNILRIVKNSFNGDAEPDVFLDQQVVDIVSPLEWHFVTNFYNDKAYSDDDIFKALAKLYHNLDNPENILRLSDFEQAIEHKVSAIMVEHPTISTEKCKLSLLRVMKSIESVSGDILGNRNYLELLYGQATGSGRWGHMFRENAT